MKTIKRELAHVGMFGQDGSGVRVTKQDLAEVAETFDGVGPITLGHELADWMPKFGDVKKLELSADGTSLSGDLEINDVLADAVDEKFYNHLSVGLPRRASDRKRYLHHVAFLGAVPPKIRDLKIFADLGVLNFGDEPKVDCFADEQPPAAANGTAIAEAIRRIADKGRASWPLKETVTALAELTSLATEMVLSGAPIPAALQEQAQAFADQLKHTAGAAGKEEDVEVKEENENLKKELSDMKARALVVAKDGIKKAMDGRIPVARQGLVLELADRLGDAETIELADESGTKEKVSSIEVLRRVLESIPKPVV
ncbi:MAG: hypothetical protein A2Y38_19350, partial [Spirochaetes bacterium GWB1_59_5]